VSVPVEQALQVASAALAAGADDAEVYLESGAIRRVIIHSGQLSDSAGRRNELALRVWCAGRQAVVTSEAGQPRALAESAVAQARAHGAPGRAVLRAGDGSGDAPRPGDAADADPVALVQTLVAALAKHRLPEPHLISAGYTGRTGYRVLVNSRGLVVRSPVTAHQLWCWWEGAGGHVRLAASGSRAAELSPEQLAEDVAEQAGCLSATGWTEPPGDRAVLLAPAAAADVARVFGRVLCAQHILGHLATLRDRVGRRIAAPALTLVDDGTLPGGVHTRPFDDEGTPTEATTLIEDGRLCGFLHTLETAERLGVRPNGKAHRSALWHPPGPAPSNTYIATGLSDPDTLRRELGYGLAISGLLRSGRVQSGTGRFTAVGYGWWLRDGEPTRRVSGVPLSVGVFELMRHITGCGDDLRFAPLADGAGSPSLLISKLRVG
jgi:predicted Zn-dependent protease